MTRPDSSGLLPILSLVKLTTEEVTRHYRTVLYPLQDRVLDLCPWPAGWVLSGGTAISRFMTNHRFSDDLGFFFYNDDPEIFLRHCVRFEDLLRQACLSVRSEVQTDYFRRFFIEDSAGNSLKIECILEPRPSIGTFRRIEKIAIDSPENLAVNKVNALIGRNLARDLFDLWHIEGLVSFPEALNLSESVYGSPVGREDLLVVAGRIQTPDELPVHATKDPDLDGFASFLSRVADEVLRRISLEAEEVKKKLHESVDLLFWDSPPPEKPVSRFSGEAASRVLEYGSSALLAALPSNTLNSLLEKSRRSLRVSDERRWLISLFAGKNKITNATTRNAIAELERGKGERFTTVDSLMADINADD